MKEFFPLTTLTAAIINWEMLSSFFDCAGLYQTHILIRYYFMIEWVCVTQIKLFFGSTCSRNGEVYMWVEKIAQIVYIFSLSDLNPSLNGREEEEEVEFAHVFVFKPPHHHPLMLHTFSLAVCSADNVILFFFRVRLMALWYHSLFFLFFFSTQHLPPASFINKYRDFSIELFSFAAWFFIGNGSLRKAYYWFFHHFFFFFAIDYC